MPSHPHHLWIGQALSGACHSEDGIGYVLCPEVIIMFVLSMLIASVIVREGDSVPQRTGGFEAVEMDVILEVCV